MTWSWENLPVSATVQIVLLALAIYPILKAARGSRFGQALMGVGVLAGAMFLFSYLFHFDVLSQIVRGLLVYLAISTVVIFQPEIRRILSQVGAFNFPERRKYFQDGSATAEFVAETVFALAERKIGALIAFERGISLRSYEDSGVVTDARFSRELLTAIFTPPLPLHDGGVTIRSGRIAAAHCVFPVSNNPELGDRGMRHRAAIGLSEETDALVIVISEETGAVSVAHNGRLVRHSGEQGEQTLLRWLVKVLPSDRENRPFFLRLFDRYTKKGDVR